MPKIKCPICGATDADAFIYVDEIPIEGTIEEGYQIFDASHGDHRFKVKYELRFIEIVE